MSSPKTLQLQDRGAFDEDDSPFLSIADFFSLISLSLIYLIVLFSPSAPANESAVEAITGSASGTGPASAVPSRIAYVSLHSDDTRLLVQVIQPGATSPESQAFEMSDAGTAGAGHWILEQLSKNEDTERVMFYMNIDEKHNQVHKSFLQLVARAHARFKVFMIFLDTDAEQL